MIKSNEIRIGNWVLENGQPVEVDAFNYYGDLMAEDPSYDDGHRNIKDPEGIPLTTEWLEKLGFITLDAETDIVIWGLEDNSNGEEFSIESDGLDSPTPLYFAYDLGYGEKRKAIKYVHQLQNLYFAIMGEEIIAKV